MNRTFFFNNFCSVIIYRERKREEVFWLFGYNVPLNV